MEAPDKIYLTVDKNEDWKYAMWTARCPQERRFSKLDKHEEYIRKDALLEWAKENHKRMVEVHSDYTKIYDEYFRGLIDKIESL